MWSTSQVWSRPILLTPPCSLVNLTSGLYSQSTGSPQCYPILWDSHWEGSIHEILHHHRFVKHWFRNTAFLISHCCKCTNLSSEIFQLWKTHGLFCRKVWFCISLLKIINEFQMDDIKFPLIFIISSNWPPLMPLINHFLRVCREWFNQWLYSSEAPATHTSTVLAVGKTGGRRY